MKKQIIILIVPMFFSCASNSNQKLDIPDWYLNPSSIDGSNISTQHIGIGSGESKSEAVIHALGWALRTIKVTKPTQILNEIEEDGEKFLESASQSYNAYEFGYISYKSSLKDYSMTGSTKSYESSEMTSILTLEGPDPIIIKSYLSATGSGKDAKSEKTFEIIPNNKKLTSFYSELAKNGINIVKEEKFGDIYFIAISINASESKFYIASEKTKVLKSHLSYV